MLNSRSKSYRLPVTFKDIQALASHKNSPNELIPDIHPLNNIESQEDYCDLSVSLVSEDSHDHKTYKNELITTIQKSLAELKSEATLYVNSGDNAIKETTKKFKESFLTGDSGNYDQETLNILIDLKQSICMLNQRLEKNEEMYTTKKMENLELQDIVASLEIKMKDSVIDQSKKKTECCCIIS